LRDVDHRSIVISSLGGEVATGVAVPVEARKYLLATSSWMRDRRSAVGVHIDELAGEVGVGRRRGDVVRCCRR
jgi:hypothetical protein